MFVGWGGIGGDIVIVTVSVWGGGGIVHILFVCVKIYILFVYSSITNLYFIV